MQDQFINSSNPSDDNIHANDMAQVSALMENDNKAWQFFLKEYRKMCLIITRQHNLSHSFDDLFSEFIIKLIGDSEKTGVLEKYDGSTSLKTYLSAVFRRIVFDCYRNKKRKGDYVLLPEIDNFSDSKFDPALQFDELDSVSNKEEASLLNAMKFLTKEEQNLIELYFYNKFSIRKIGGILGWSKSKVARHLEKIYGKLRKEIAKENEIFQSQINST